MTSLLPLLLLRRRRWCSVVQIESAKGARVAEAPAQRAEGAIVAEGLAQAKRKREMQQSFLS